MRRLKKSLFRFIGPSLYRLLHAGYFFARLLRALNDSVPGSSDKAGKFARRFFGADLLAFADRMRPGDLVLDIGAFLGGSTALFARAVGASGRVIAFEPVHHKFLGFLIKALRLKAARLIPAGLAAEKAETEFVIPMLHGIPLYSQAGFSDAFAAPDPASGEVYTFLRRPAHLLRLDDFLAGENIDPSKVAAVKIDVEGSEMGLFSGAENFFRRFDGALLCEFWFNQMPPPGWLWLKERGYHCRYLSRDGVWREADDEASLREIGRGETYGNFFWARRKEETEIPPARTV